MYLNHKTKSTLFEISNDLSMNTSFFHTDTTISFSYP